MFNGLSVLELITLLFFMLTPFMLMLIALVDILKNNFEGYYKIVWILVVIFVPVIGAILYFVIGKQQKIKI